MKDIRPCDLPSPTALAFLGDAVYSLHIRRHVMERVGLDKDALHTETVSYVTASAQARAYEAVEPVLTEAEADVCRRARNSTHLSKPRKAEGGDYRRATALEALLGMLYYTEQHDRLREILDICTAAHAAEENI